MTVDANAPTQPSAQIAASGGEVEASTDSALEVRPRRRRSRPTGWFRTTVVVGAVMTGGLERWWVASHPIGTLTSDGSVIGLMALQLLHHGQLPAYMWGQAYGASLEAVFTAGVFALTGVGTSQLLAVTALSSALATIALWRTGRVIVGDRAALVGALAFWVWPASFIWRSLKPGGTYMIGLAIALCAVGALARVRRGEDGWTRVAWAGLLCGLALWSSPMSLQLLIPAGVWFAPNLVRLRARSGALLAGAFVGATPVLVFGVGHGWTNLVVPGHHWLLAQIPDRLRQFFTVEAPIALSLRVEGSLAWLGGLLGVTLAWLAALAVIAAVIAVACGRARRCRLPVLTLLCLPVLFALNPLANHVGQGRYVLFGSSMAALLVGVALEDAGPVAARLWRRVVGRLRTGPSESTVSRRGRATVLWPVGMVLLGALGIMALSREPASSLVGFPAPDVPMPTDTSPLRALLASHHVRDAYADYWIAYRITFETRWGTDVVPTDYERYRPLTEHVDASRRPAYVFVSTSATLGRFEAWCHGEGIALQVWRAGAFSVVQPGKKVLPSRVPSGVLQ